MRHPQRRPGAKGGASRPDCATINNHATANHRALIGHAPALLRGCASLTPHYGVIANVGHR